MADWRVRRGETFYVPSAIGEHLHVVLCNPTDFPGYPTQSVICVGIFSRRQPQHDTTILLDVGDHRFIKHSSYVDFSRAGMRRAAEIQKAVDRSLIRTDDAVTDEVLVRIIDGALDSARTPRYIKLLLS